MKNKTTKNTTPKKSKLLSYLENGNTITEKQAKSRFKLKNIRATISDLREENYDIVTTRTKTGTKYSMA